jgi:hypothetical protein
MPLDHHEQESRCLVWKSLSNISLVLSSSKGGFLTVHLPQPSILSKLGRQYPQSIIFHYTSSSGIINIDVDLIRASIHGILQQLCDNSIGACDCGRGFDLCNNRWGERLNRHLVAFAVASKHCLRSDWEWKAEDN